MGRDFYMSPGISLCMIVKNEERCIRRCLESVQGIVDEIIIVDTGSTDSTIEIAREYTDRIYSYEWKDNFAEARNFALEHATMSYILQLDADEVINDTDDIFGQPLDKDLYFIRIRNDLGSGLSEIHQFVRIFRNDPKIRYEGALHEQINMLKENTNYSFDFLGSIIEHDGYLNQIVKSKDKYNRNMKILKEQIKHNPSSFNYYNLATQYNYSNQHGKALDAYTKSFQLANNLTFTNKVLIGITNSLMKLGRYKEAVKVGEDTAQLYPDFTDNYYRMGVLYEEMGYWKDAEAYFLKCLELGENSNRKSFNHHEGTGSYLAAARLAELYLDNNQLDKSLKYLREAIKLNPDLIALLPIFLRLHPQLTSIQLMEAVIKVWPSEENRLKNLIAAFYSLRHPVLIEFVNCYNIDVTIAVRPFVEIVKGNLDSAKQAIETSITEGKEINPRDLLYIAFQNSDSHILTTNRHLLDLRDKEFKWFVQLVQGKKMSPVMLSPKSMKMFEHFVLDLVHLQKFDSIQRMINLITAPELRLIIANILYDFKYFDVVLDILISGEDVTINEKVYSLAAKTLTQLGNVEDAIYYYQLAYNSKVSFINGYNLLMLMQEAGDFDGAQRIKRDLLNNLDPVSLWLQGVDK